jgi:hypothetical protein
MPKDLTSAMRAHLGLETTRLCTAWRIVRTDGQEFFFTDHDRDLVFDGDTYLSATGFDRTAISNDLTFAVDNLDVTGITDASQIDEAEIRAGVYIFLLFWDDPDTYGPLKLRKGTIGQTSITWEGHFTAEIRGLAQPLSQNTLTTYTPDCLHDLGDARCGFPIWPDEVARDTSYPSGQFVRASNSGGSLSEDFDDRIYECVTAGTTASVQPAYDTTIGNDTTDGTAVFRAYDAFTRSDVVSAVTSDREFAGTDLAAFADGHFDHGLLLWETGNNAGKAYEVQSFVQSGQTIELWEPARLTVQVGDKFRISPGCKKRVVQDCRDTFKILGSRLFHVGNAKNFGGFPFVPGAGFAAINPRND